MHGASRPALPRLRVRVFSPLAKLGPLRAPRGGCRALSEDFRTPIEPGPEPKMKGFGFLRFLGISKGLGFLGISKGLGFYRFGVWGF